MPSKFESISFSISLFFLKCSRLDNLAQHCCQSNIKSKTFFSIKCKQIKSKQTYLLDWLGLTGGPWGLSGGLCSRLPSGLNWAFAKPNHTTDTNSSNNTLQIILTKFSCKLFLFIWHVSFFFSSNGTTHCSQFLPLVAPADNSQCLGVGKER